MVSDSVLDSAEADRGLLQRAKTLLYQRGYGPHRTSEISVERGVVLIQGRVPTFYLRLIAVECIKRVAGVTQVIDPVEVVYVSGDCHVKECSADDPKNSTLSTEHREDLLDANIARRGSNPFSSSPPSFVRNGITLKVLTP